MRSFGGARAPQLTGQRHSANNQKAGVSKEADLPRGSYGTPMTTFRVPRRKPDPRRQGTCPKCYAMQGEPCRARPGVRPRNGVHAVRLKANGIDPKTLPADQGGAAGKQRRRKKGQQRQRRPGAAKAVPPTAARTGSEGDATKGDQKARPTCAT